MPVIKKLPTNGSEIVFSLQPWVSVGKKSNNCYAYAVNDFELYRIQKSTPGDRTKRNNSRLPPYSTVSGLSKRMLLDNPKKIYKTRACTKCRKNFYKIMMFTSLDNGIPGTFGDFHYYKQHSEVQYRVKPGDTYVKIAKFFGVPVKRVQAAGKIVPGKTLQFKANCWSHKQGWGTGPLLKDASGKPIRDPRFADKKYPGLNYNIYGGSFCVKNKGVDVGKTHA